MINEARGSVVVRFIKDDLMCHTSVNIVLSLEQTSQHNI